ncbi:MAG: zinc ribbon domain-containing protein [Candidatus Adiutrix sp.]|jgi:putative FmdB family regulatory protein|nr:zinc ribbon domain-containing protein [Candidatus Adiutrix sp.]
MPIYEYQCGSCGETAEVLQKFSDAPLSRCPSCGGPVSKLMSANSFQLKGQGWYVTDYAGKKSSEAAKKNEGTPAKEASAEAKGSAAKEAPAKKAEAPKKV